MEFNAVDIIAPELLKAYSKILSFLQHKTFLKAIFYLRREKNV